MKKIRLKEARIGDKVKFSCRGEIWTVTQNTPMYKPPIIILENKAGEQDFGDPDKKVYRV